MGRSGLPRRALCGLHLALLVLSYVLGSWSHGRDSEDVSSEETGGWDGDTDLDQELRDALRQCADLYGARPRPNRVSALGDGAVNASGPGPGDDAPPWRRNKSVQCQQRSRRSAVDGSGAGRSRLTSRRTPGWSPPPGGTWVTYYGLHQPVDPARAARRGGSHVRQGDVAACVLHCAFARAELVSEAGLLDEARVVSRLEDSVRLPRQRVTAVRSARACFVRLGSVSDIDDDPCFYTMKFAKCMDMGIVKDFNKIKDNINL